MSEEIRSLLWTFGASLKRLATSDWSRRCVLLLIALVFMAASDSPVSSQGIRDGITIDSITVHMLGASGLSAQSVWALDSSLEHRKTYQFEATVSYELGSQQHGFIGLYAHPADNPYLTDQIGDLVEVSSGPGSVTVQTLYTVPPIPLSEQFSGQFSGVVVEALLLDDFWNIMDAAQSGVFPVSQGDQSKIYLPLVLKDFGSTQKISTPHGRVTKNGIGVGNVSLTLRLYDGSSWSTYATAQTLGDGSYVFPNAPSIALGQAYYVRYRNSEGDPGCLWYWACYSVTYDEQNDQDALECSFDIGDVVLGPPLTRSTALPASFYWTQRSTVSIDSYEFNVYDPWGNAWWWTDPPLGYVRGYTLKSLPADFVSDYEYWWEVWVYGPDGFGISYDYYLVTFVGIGSSQQISAMSALTHAQSTKPMAEPPPHRSP